MGATLKTRFPMIQAELAKRVPVAVKEGADLIAEDAQQRVHQRTEDLYHAIHTERRGLGRYAVVAGNDDVFWGHLVEFGTSHSAAYPFMVPAAEAQGENCVNLVRLALQGL